MTSGAPAGPLDLIVRLCEALAVAGVRYCHWKSTATLDRAQLGEGDLDLLVDRRGSQRFLQVLRRLGFKEARAARELPGVFHAYGLDAPSGRLVHVHAHYVLVLGDDMTKNYRLPVEDAYLSMATQAAVFRVPAPEFELAVLVVRLVLKHAAWDAMLIGRGPLSAAEAHELHDLTSRVPTATVRDCVRAQLPAIGESLWQDCLRALQPGAGPWFRARTARRLEASLAGCGRRPWATDTLLKLTRRVGGFLLRRVARRRNPRLRLDTGGALIAIVGADDAARSSLVSAVHGWLARDFEAVTVAPAEHSPTPGSLARRVTRGRASYRRYVRARRLAFRGTLVICDGFPARELAPDQLPDPDLLIVLRPGPASAGAELPHRSRPGTPACVVDASQPPEGVLAEIKRCVWSSL